jgi:hypothetical protein
MITVLTTVPGVSLQPHIKNLSQTVQAKSALSLFVLRILTDDPDASFSLDDFAFLANRFN